MVAILNGGLSNTILKAHHDIPAKFGPVVSEKIFKCDLLSKYGLFS
jgi:hypothetical protein